jgi:hypothetical protein
MSGHVGFLRKSVPANGAITSLPFIQLLERRRVVCFVHGDLRRCRLRNNAPKYFLYLPATSLVSPTYPKYIDIEDRLYNLEMLFSLVGMVAGTELSSF